MSGKVLFVCTANICRSPMAEAVFNDLADEKGLSLVAESAGVRAGSGYGIAAHSRQALEEFGFEVGDHLSRRVSKEMISGSDLILVMEPWHAEEIEGHFGSSGKTYVLPTFAGISREREISDPYGLTLFAHRASLRQIYSHVQAALKRLSEEGFPQ